MAQVLCCTTMAIPTYLMIILVLMTTLSLGDQQPDGKAIQSPIMGDKTRVAEYGELGDVEPRISSDPSDENFFNANDTPCVINDGSTQYLENCHEETDKPTPLVLRKTWDSGVELEALLLPADFVVIKDGGHYCNSTSDCLSQLQSMRKMSKISGCDLRENFYVGGDGKVYEGRGWDSASYWDLNGLRKKSITVQFLGLHVRTLPSTTAIEAFETTLNIGLWLGKLSKTFRITSFRQLHRDSKVSEDVLSQNPMGSDRWVSGEELSSLWEYTLPGGLRFVFRKQWNASKPTRELATISQAVSYVAVSEEGDRCLKETDCIFKMRAKQAGHIDDYGDLPDNFYIGDGGKVYEGRGWNFAPHWLVNGIENKFISVRLLGSYQNESQMQEVNSLKLLVQTGVWLGKITPNHRIFRLRQIYDQSVLPVSPLLDLASKWSTWAGGDFINSTPNQFSLITYMRRAGWNGLATSISFSRNQKPIKYVMIGDGGSRCFSVEHCSTRMRSEQNLSIPQYGDLMDNFYVGDDGMVYEGRGWDSIPFLNTPFFNDSLIAVKFLGSFKSSLPSEPAWLAFLALIDAGISSNKISPDYKLYSFRHIYNDSSLLGDKATLLFEGMRAWDGKLSMVSEDNRWSSGILPIYSLNRTTNHVWHEEYSPLNLPAEYVIVGYSGERCFTAESCKISMNERKTLEARNFKNFLYNFYVTEDGKIYVGCGWISSCYLHVQGVKADSIFVTFLGNFKNSLPSPHALLAFNRLLQFGVGTGKLAVDHKIISLRQIYPKSSHSSVAFAEKVKSWGRWSEYQALSFGGVSIPFGPSAFVPKSQWSDRGLPQNDSQNLNLPISHLIILDAGDSCNNLEDCILRLKAEESRTHPRFGDEMENFYIGEDGRIYEGRGWSQKTHWYSKILNIDFITVAFLGKFHSQPPSLKAITAFEYFYKKGVMEEKLKPDHVIYSLCQFNLIGHIPREALDNYIRTWKNWSNETSPAFFVVEISSPSVWGSSKGIIRSNTISHPLFYVYVREGGSPCSSNSECISRMKTIENENDAISENFYIGGTGEVFEGIGWLYDTKWSYDGWKDSISVQFLGTFESSVPTMDALNAFTHLCDHGVRHGYIHPDYKILFIPDNYSSRFWVGIKFKDLIKSWERWVPRI